MVLCFVMVFRTYALSDLVFVGDAKLLRKHLNSIDWILIANDFCFVNYYQINFINTTPCYKFASM